MRLSFLRGIPMLKLTGDTLRPGSDIVPDHVLIEKLGEGEFGEVWSAVGPGAVQKAVKFSLIGQDKGLREFCGIRRMRDVRGAFLVPITDIWLFDERLRPLADEAMRQVEGQVQGGTHDLARTMLPDFGEPSLLVVAMQKCDKTLGQLLKEHTDQGADGIPIDELLSYMEDAARGIDDLNAPKHKPVFLAEGQTQQDLDGQRVSLIHGDIKPDNIMLVGNGAMICDFSLAEVLGGTECLRKTMEKPAGTFVYMAPETWKGKKSLKGDQYSLAITYCELRTGDWPYTAQARSSMYHMQEAKDHEQFDLSSLPEPEQKVIRRALCLDPERRHGSCVEMINALKMAVKGEEPPPPPPSLLRRIARLIVLACVVGAAAWIVAVISNDGDSFARVREILQQEELKQGEMDEALRFAKKFNVNQLNDVFPGFIKHLNSNEDADDLRHAVILLKPVSAEKIQDDVDEERRAKLQQIVRMGLERDRNQLRSAIDGFDPKVGEGSSRELQEQIKKLRTLHEDSLVGLDNRQWFSASLDLLQARINVREILTAETRNEKTIKTIRNTLNELVQSLRESEDSVYVDVLDFLLDDQGLDDQDLVKARMEESVRITGQVTGVTLPNWQLAEWENDRLQKEKERIRDAVNIKWLLGWLDDKEFATSLETFYETKSPSAMFLGEARTKRKQENYDEAQDFAKVSRKLNGNNRDEKERTDLNRSLWEEFFQLAVIRRKQEKYDIAKKLLEDARQLNRDEPDATRKADTQNKIDDEQIVLYLVDPDTPEDTLYNSLAPQEPDYQSWYTIANRLLSEQTDLPDETVALLQAIRLESGLLTAEPLPKLDNAIEWSENLNDSRFADYGTYVLALLVAKSKSPKEAAKSIHTVFLHEESDLHPLLRAPFRKNEAARILRNAAHDWKPTDARFGVMDERMDRAFRDLGLARKLSPSSLDGKDNATWLLSAALLLDEKSEDTKPDLEEMRTVSSALLELIEKEPSSSDDLGDLRGSIHFARARVLLEKNGEDRGVLQHFADALEILYLSDRPDRQNNVDQCEAIYRHIIQNVWLVAETAFSAIDHFEPQERKQRKKQLAIIYRSAGFIFRQPTVADEIRVYRKKNPDDLAYFALSRANELAPNADALVEQGRALKERTRKGPRWREELNELASAALKLSPTHVGAHQLKGTAFLLMSRNQIRSLAHRRRDLDRAIKQYDEAVDLSEESKTTSASKLASCRVERSSAHVEYVFYANMNDDAKEKHLRKACEDAEFATKIKERQKPEHAYIAWGNALEDLAHYLWKDPPRNFEEAIDKFESADEKASAVGRYSGVETKMNLLRCRVRQVQSAVLPSNEELPDLQKTVGACVLLVQKLQRDLKSDSGVRPDVPWNAAEFLYWVSVAYEEMATKCERDTEKRDEYLEAAKDACQNSVILADIAGNKYWAYGKLRMADLVSREGDLVSAKDHVTDVISKYDNNENRLPIGWQQLESAVEKLNGFDREGGGQWKDEDWERHLRRFPDNRPDADAHRIGLLVFRYKRSGKGEPDKIANEIEALMNQSPVLAHRLRADLREQEGRNFGSLALKALKANDGEHYRQHLRMARKKLVAALEDRDRYLPKNLRTELDRLADRNAESNRWHELKRWRWKREKLSAHISSTFSTREDLAMVLRNLCLLDPAPSDRKDLAEEGMKIILPLRKEIVGDAAVAKAWFRNEYGEQLQKIFEESS